MTTNDFILHSSKSGNAVKLKAKKLLDLRLDTMNLAMENREMEQKLHQLQLNMEKEREERQHSSGHRWKSGQAVGMNYASQASLQSKDSSVKPSQISSGRMKLKVLKDYNPEPVKQPVAHKSSLIASMDKPKIKGKACGQCENKNALLKCLECGEDYCVSCFTKIHQKGALKLHRTSPVQGKYTPIGKLDAAQQFKKDIDLNLVRHDTNKDISSLLKTMSPFGMFPSDSAESVSTLSTKPFHEKLDGGSLLHGTFNEEESSKSFKAILMDWRNGNPDYKGKPSSFQFETESVGESEVQTLLTGVRKSVDIEFTENGLNYLEKLLLKKHRRTPVDQVLSVQLSELRHSNTLLDEPQRDLNEGDSGLTAEEMEDHECYAALFRTQTSEVDPERSISSLRIIELNDACEEDIEESTSFVVHEVESIDSNGDQSGTVTKLQNNSCFEEKSDSSLFDATERTRQPPLHSNHLVDKGTFSNPSNGNKRQRSSTKATLPSLHGPGNSLSETVNCGPRDRASTKKKSTQLGIQPHVCCSISPGPTLNAFPADSKYFSITQRSLIGDKQMVEPCNVNHSKDFDQSADTSSTMETEDIRLKVRSIVSPYRGLEGFFILGVEPKEVHQKSYPPKKSELAPVDNVILCTGNGQWRPDSSLCEYADDDVVQHLVESARNRPSSSSGHHALSPRIGPVVYAPQGYKSQIPLSANPARHKGSSGSRPASAAARPLSRAASEISEIESIDVTEQDDPLLEEDAVQQTLTGLEKELDELKTNLDPASSCHKLSAEELLNFRKNSKKRSMTISDSNTSAVMADATKVTISAEETESEYCFPSSMSFDGECETDDDEEEQSHQDKKHVMSLC